MTQSCHSSMRLSKKTKQSKNDLDGSVGVGGAFYQAWARSKFSPWNTHDNRSEPVPASCPLTPTHILYEYTCTPTPLIIHKYFLKDCGLFFKKKIKTARVSTFQKAIKSVWEWCEHTQSSQLNKTESSQLLPSAVHSLLFQLCVCVEQGTQQKKSLLDSWCWGYLGFI